jgi:hypothetical protein
MPLFFLLYELPSRHNIRTKSLFFKFCLFACTFCVLSISPSCLDVCSNVGMIIVCGGLQFWFGSFNSFYTLRSCIKALLHLHIAFKVTPLADFKLGGCKLRWTTFFITLQVFVECHALTCHKIIIMPQKFIELKFSTWIRRHLHKKIITCIFQIYSWDFWS